MTSRQRRGSFFSLGACGCALLALHTAYVLALHLPRGQPAIVLPAVNALNLVAGYASVLITYWGINLVTQPYRRLQVLSNLGYLLVYGVLAAYAAATSEGFDYAVLRENFRLLLDPAATGVILGSLDRKILAGGVLATACLLVGERRWRWLSALPTPTFRLRVAAACGLAHIAFVVATPPATDAWVGFLQSVYSYYHVDVRGALAQRGIAYPLIRTAPATSPTSDTIRPPHVFLLMIESYNARYVEATTEDGREYTPYFNHLIPQGWYVERFYGNSVQTSKGQFATLFSVIPSLRGKEFVEYAFNRYYSLPQVLRDHGYRTVFFQGHADLDFDNTRVFLGRNGFDDCRSVQAFLKPVDKPYIWGWGPEDEVVYRRFFDYVDSFLGEQDVPLFAVIATIQNHAGSTLPPNRRLLYPQPKSARENLANAIYLSDRQLAVFFAELARRPALQDSLVIITGDHSYPTGDHGIEHSATGHYEESFRTPLLILRPGKLQPRRIPGPYSQLDIAPTVADLVGVWLDRHHFAGKSVSTGGSARVYLVQPYDGGWLGVIDHPLKYVTSLRDSSEEVFDLSADPNETHNLIDDLADDVRLATLRSAIDDILLTQYLIRHDRVWDGQDVRHQPWPPAGPLVIGHRGNSGTAPENTLVAIAEAFDLGAHMVEIDLRLSSDGVPVVIHDDTVDRTTNGTGKVAKLTLAELQTLDAGSWKDARYAGERIPTLVEVLQQTGGKGRLLLDAKIEALGSAVAQAFRAAGVPFARAVVGTWDERQRQDFALHLPGALILRTGAAPLRWTTTFFADARRRGAAGFEVGDAWPEAFVAAAHAEGMPVYAYTVNDEPTLRQLLSSGIDGIETDYPGRLKDLLEGSAPSR